MRESPWRLALLAVLGAGYLWLGHLGSSSAHPPAISLISGLIPLWAVALLLAWGAKLRYLWLGLLGVLTLALLLNLESLRQNTAWVYFVQHAGMYGLLAIAFGRTLFGRHEEALCSRIAHVAHRGLPPHMARYTWQVTLAWTIFFLSVTLISVLLFAFASLTQWSIFANLLSAPLLGLMFGGEALVRHRVLPNDSHVGILDTIRAYRDYSRQAGPKP